MKILGIPFAAPLAVIVGFADLIPLVGATIAAVLVGIVTMFGGFPIDTIIWVIWAVVYQQLENTSSSPRSSAARSTCTRSWCWSPSSSAQAVRIAGALLAIPGAASLQIAATEWWHFRQSARPEALPDA